MSGIRDQALGGEASDSRPVVTAGPPAGDSVGATVRRRTGSADGRVTSHLPEDRGPLFRDEVTPLVKPVKVKKAKKRRSGLTPMREADRLSSLIVRTRGRCEARTVAKCPSGPLQNAHGFSRSYKAVRYDERNLFCLCQGCHKHYTDRPIEWNDWLLERWGADLYAEMRALALTHRVPKYPDLIRALSERLATIERRSA